jgi:hypothetical protein
MEIFGIIVFVIVGIVIFVLQTDFHERRIAKQIESMGGKVLSIERKFFDNGPFILAGKGTTIYRIEYRVRNKDQEGWVKFGGLFGTDWRL